MCSMAISFPGKAANTSPPGDLRTILGLVFISARCLSRLVLELFLL